MARQSNTPLRLPIITTPASPPTGYVDQYAKSDKHLYQLDSSGVETDLAAAPPVAKQRTFAYWVA